MKKITILLLAFILLTGTLVGCTPDETPEVSETETEATTDATEEPTAEPTQEPAIELAGEELEIKYSSSFSITTYGNDIKLVTDGEGQKFFLVPKSIDEVPTLPTEAADATVIRTPVDSAVFGSTTQVGSLLAIADDAVLDSIGGVSSGAYSWYIDAIEERLADGRIAFIGGDGFTDPDYEAIIALEPDIAFLYTGDWGQQDIMTKLTELGISSAIDNDYLEGGYMSRLEWIRFIAAFYNLDEVAYDYMLEQEVLVESVKADIESLDKPKVVWASIWEGIVYVTGADTYAAKQITDAGGEYVFADYGDTSAGLTMEEFYEQSKDADILIYASNAMWMTNPTITGILEMAPVLAEMKAVIDGNVYALSDDYFTASYKVARSVKDLAAMFNPELYTDWSIESYDKLPE